MEKFKVSEGSVTLSMKRVGRLGISTKCGPSRAARGSDASFDHVGSSNLTTFSLAVQENPATIRKNLDAVRRTSGPGLGET